MAFISVSYFDQIRVFWFWLLAVIPALPLVAGSLSNPVPSNEPGPSVLGAPDQLAMP
jgi:hypothetical protein